MEFIADEKYQCNEEYRQVHASEDCPEFERFWLKTLFSIFILVGWLNPLCWGRLLGGIHRRCGRHYQYRKDECKSGFVFAYRTILRNCEMNLIYTARYNRGTTTESAKCGRISEDRDILNTRALAALLCRAMIKPEVRRSRDGIFPACDWSIFE